MNGNTHVWLVEDALRFVMARGNSREKNAFQAWENAYGGGDLPTTPASQTRIVDVIGQESRYTDYYHDLAIYLESFAGFWQDNISEYDGHIFTALNHFLAVPWYPTHWRLTNGYYYFWSARTGNDSRAMTGKVDNKDAEVDNENSPVVDRVRFGWTSSAGVWNDNWEADIRYTVFAPVSALARYYYYRLLYRWFTHVDVNGVRFDRINGMYLLGPVCHAVADACVPQHAITTMDLKHQEWENAVETWAWGYELEDFNQVRTLLDTHMKRYNATSGDLQGMLAVDYLVSELCGWKTFVTFLQQNALPDVNAMRKPSFWNGYMSNLAKVKADAKLYYNLAIAATVRVITEGCYDVIATGGGSNPDPKLNGVKSYQLVGGIPSRKPVVPGTFHPPIRPTLPYFKVQSLLGFKPQEWRSAASTLAVTRDTLACWRKENLPEREVYASLDRLEGEFLLQFKKARASGIQKFPPPANLSFPAHADKLRQDCGLPAVSANLETRPSFGMATFRNPTPEEASDGEKFKAYLADAEANVVNAKLLSVTRCIALHKLFLAETPDRIRTRKLKEAIAGLERARAFILSKKQLPPERWPAGKVEMKVADPTAARPAADVTPS